MAFQTAALAWHQDPELDSLGTDIFTARTEFFIPIPQSRGRGEFDLPRPSIVVRFYDQCDGSAADTRVPTLLDFFFFRRVL
jgi:tRNA nucleotidyltransferase (CCA-adding enzyme)